VPRSDRLELRPLDVGDAAFVRSLYASVEVTRTLLRIQGPISLEEAREFCRAPAQVRGDHRFGGALKSDGRLIAVGSIHGLAGPSRIASIGYSVLPAFWGQGLGTEMAARLVELAAGTLGVLDVRATTLDDNPASARILDKLGFRILEAGASEVDSHGDERRVTRWRLAGDAEP
jgi:[ribosomal protein S5]-alanine N-acetyltransferase